MKELTLEQFAQNIQPTLETAQQERVVITREGQPVAVLLGIEHKDEEDWRLQLSPEFWRMIEERRRQPTIPLEQLEAELQLGNLPLCRYSMVIQWSDEEQAFVTSLPEFGEFNKARGASYEEAAVNGQEVLDRLIETYEAQGKPLPEPTKLGSPVSVA